MLFPDAAIELLRETIFSPDATRTYEFMSGGFVCSDEGRGDAGWICIEVDNWAYRHVIAYRASLIRSEPREDLRGPWDQLQSAFPDWPGFRPDRCDPNLSAELDECNERATRDMDDLDRRISEAKKNQPGKAE